jgi:glucosamine--fructose-6-phosphate aminotransferase (isomerizing)
VTTQPTFMRRETAEAGQAVAKLLREEAETFVEIRRIFARNKPGFITTTARGSSGHAASFFKYLFEISAGRPVADIGPSVTSVYGASLDLTGSLHFTVSQSGGSPDIIAMQAAAAKGGATTVAVVNVTDSPLAREADIVLPLHAGPEHSVAATKSCIAAAAALAAVAGHIADDEALLGGLENLPSALDGALGHVPETLVSRLASVKSMFTAGRGPGLAMALEAALKAKETSAIHAEAFSLAEVMHGPIRLIDTDFPVVAFMGSDKALEANCNAAEHLRRLGADVTTIGISDNNTLKSPTTGHGFVDPLVGLASYYDLIEHVSIAKGFDPDKPFNLKKVTRTV